MQVLEPTRRTDPVSRLDPRVRAVAAIACTLFVVLLERWTALGVGLLSAVLLAAAAHALDRATLRRLGHLNLFVVFLLAVTPLSMPGRPLWQLAGLTWTVEGTLFALRVGAKANMVMLLCSALLSTMEPADLAHALYQLHLPAKLAHALFFCVRYLELLHVEYHRLRNAMRLRAYHAGCSRHALRSLGYLVGMLFVRSCDRSDRVLEAMKCRGFDGRLYSLAAFTAGRRDAAFGAVVVMAAALIGCLEWTPWIH